MIDFSTYLIFYQLVVANYMFGNYKFFEFIACAKNAKGSNRTPLSNQEYSLYGFIVLIENSYNYIKCN